MLPPLAAANNGPGSGQISIEMVKFGALLFIGGVAFLWLARGVWRSKLWRTRVAIVFSVAALAHLIAALSRSLTPFGAVRDDVTGRMVPVYDGRSGPVALFIVLYLVAMICLVLAEHRLTRAVANGGGPAPAEHGRMDE